MRITIGISSLIVFLTLASSTARADDAVAKREAHPIDGAHLAFGLDAGYMGPFGDVGLRLSVAINRYVSIEAGAGMGYVRAEAGALVRVRRTNDGSGLMAGLGLTRGAEYGHADGDEWVDAVRGVLEVGGYGRMGPRSVFVFRFGLKATRDVVTYSTSYSTDGYSDELPRVQLFAGISLMTSAAL